MWVSISDWFMYLRVYIWLVYLFECLHLISLCMWVSISVWCMYVSVIHLIGLCRWVSTSDWSMYMSVYIWLVYVCECLHLIGVFMWVSIYIWLVYCRNNRFMIWLQTDVWVHLHPSQLKMVKLLLWRGLWNR